MKMTKAMRERIRMMFGGRCAYCGEPLGQRWHVDHVEPIVRKLKYIQGKGLVQTGEAYIPENDRADNMMPACPPCNIDKHSFDLEYWRRKLQQSCDVLTRNHPTYRHAKRFGLIAETGATIKFYFERVAEEAKAA